MVQFALPIHVMQAIVVRREMEPVYIVVVGHGIVPVVMSQIHVRMELDVILTAQVMVIVVVMYVLITRGLICVVLIGVFAKGDIVYAIVMVAVVLWVDHTHATKVELTAISQPHVLILDIFVKMIVLEIIAVVESQNAVAIRAVGRVLL